MLRFVARRLLVGLVLLAVVTLATFVIFYVLPAADPAKQRAGRHATPAQIENIRRSQGLDKPVLEQYLVYTRNIVTEFDFGRSYVSNAEVGPILLDRIPATISLTAGAVVLWLTAAFAIGTLSAVKRRTWIDRAAMTAALVALSAPVYWLGLIALYLFSTDLGVLPLLPGQDTYVPFGESPARWFASLLLPWAVLATSFAAIYARVLRDNLLSVLGEDYIRTARAKGLSERRVVFRHGVRAAVTPVVTLLGVDIGVLLGGAILTETVFNIPGLGREAFSAIGAGDLPIVQGAVIFTAGAIIVFNLLVDIAYALLDPRVRVT